MVLAPNGKGLRPKAQTGPVVTNAAHAARCGAQAPGGTHHSVTLLWARMTEVSMSMGWYLMPRSSMASSRAPTTYRASWRSVQGTSMCESRRNAAQATYKERLKRLLNERELQGKGVAELGTAALSGESSQPAALRRALGQARCFCLALGRAVPRPLPPREPHVGWWLPRGTWSRGWHCASPLTVLCPGTCRGPGTASTPGSL